MTSRGPRMTSGFGVDVDIETGEPLVETGDARAAREQAKAQDALSEAQSTRMALESVEGNLLLTRMEEVLEARINELIQLDPQCQGMLRVVGAFQSKLQLGRRAAQKILEPLRGQSNRMG